jgi:hypothetical protein
MAFDNSPATRWRSWETARPGMYLEVNFEEAKALNEVDIDAPPYPSSVRLQLEGAGDDGRWNIISSAPETKIIAVSIQIRRQASRELRARGIEYILMRDTDWGAKDMHENQSAWGLREIAVDTGNRLYKIEDD